MREQILERIEQHFMHAQECKDQKDRAGMMFYLGMITELEFISTLKDDLTREDRDTIDNRISDMILK
jgi:hypothetical protein